MRTCVRDPLAGALTDTRAGTRRMKIIGVTYGPQKTLLLKGDSALLVNRKPFFIPDETTSPVAYPALALRVCRLGKTIAPRYADRYYDAIAPALDIQAADLLAQAQAQGQPWTTAISLDGSFPLGEWSETHEPHVTYETNGTNKLALEAADSEIREAVSLVSRYMTIRQGDVIYLQLTDRPIELKLDDLITARLDGDETDALFCRIK